ncbi:MAG TPA: serine/threonine-protein kinase, partial [Urbifossiella sp.]|nr:serine/threonine-protein kinase [Urbifossiella sp.]
MTEMSPAEAVFFAALEQPAAGRAAYLDMACTGDAALRARVEKLLAAHPRVGGFLEPEVAGNETGTFGGSDRLDAGPPEAFPEVEAAPELTTDYPGRDEHVGAVIAGKYTLVEAVGEGGMGSVWRAKQTEPVKRFVAVKLIKAGMDSKQVLARFEAERQALALMDHPNIAKVFDGGLHSHRPFFVMELVKGVPITEYCDHAKLTPKHRLELFVQVCQAIQHAHQKGIIHRDIKPSNVLIALYDDKPVVKVIDFGVAKATGGALTEQTIDTGFGGVVGTPQYMSPEQATFNNLDIDTRSDVYALGVLLYELLTGSPPFPRKELEKKGLMEILRVVREEEPPRPSTRLSTANALPTLSANRGTEPRRLTGLLRNELDWLVMKALEKDRARRYETANGFAADVQRYLGGEAVQAHPPSTAYRLKKFARRNKGQVIAASLLFLTLLIGLAGTSWGFIRAEQQRRIAELSREAEAERAEGEAKQRQRAEIGEKLAGERLELVVAERDAKDIARADAEAISQFLGEVFQSPDPIRDGRTITVAETLSRAANKLTADRAIPAGPRARLQNTLARTYFALGMASQAIPLQENVR